ncbi:MAG: hypothetical protein ACYDBS_11880 [Acidimicrobiales bacterium]
MTGCEDLPVLGYGVHLVHADGLEYATDEAVGERQPRGERAWLCSSRLVE